MDVLLDSHSLIWALDNPNMLRPVAAATLRDPKNRLHLSVASVWEIAIKVAKGRVPLSLPFRMWMEKAILDLGLVLLPITLDHAERLLSLAFHHRDPFDRMLIAQSIEEDWPIITSDVVFKKYPVRVIW